MSLVKALEEYTAIVVGMSTEYAQSDLTVAIIREEHPELNFMDDGEIKTLIRQAKANRPAGANTGAREGADRHETVHTGRTDASRKP